MVKTKNIFIFWAFISLLLFSCNPDEGSQPKRSRNNIAKDCKDSKPTLTLKTKGTAKLNYSDEPRYSEQWYLNNSKEPNLDINIVPRSNKGYSSKDIAVRILDWAIDQNHLELKDIEVVTGFNSYKANKADATRVTGIIAARDNDIGINYNTYLCEGYRNGECILERTNPIITHTSAGVSEPTS